MLEATLFIGIYIWREPEEAPNRSPLFLLVDCAVLLAVHVKLSLFFFFVQLPHLGHWIAKFHSLNHLHVLGLVGLRVRAGCVLMV